ncbi:MAG: protein-disulfide isomerase [Cognaticolwellia sp.]|jgi:protein-disulfide isomerase
MIFLLLACVPKQPPTPPTPPTVAAPAPKASLPVLDFSLPADRPTFSGSDDAPNTLVLFTDYECPYCQMAHQELKSFADRDDLRIVALNFPLHSDCNAGVGTQMHPKACSSAIATECAHQQGRYAEMASRLAMPGSDLSAAGTQALATELDFDSVAYTRCVEDPATLEQVKADAALGTTLGIRGTPSFVLQKPDGVWYGLDGLHQLSEQLPD